MDTAVVLNSEDIKKIIAQHFGVEEKQVIKSQYTFTVIGLKADGGKQNG